MGRLLEDKSIKSHVWFLFKAVISLDIALTHNGCDEAYL